MTNIQYLIVGQGICGTFLSWYLEKSGASYLVIDNNDPSSSSRVAAGVINPVTGRRIVKTWMIDTLLPFAKKAYEEIGSSLNVGAIREITIANLFPSAQMRNAFIERIAENDEYLALAKDDHRFRYYLEYPFGHGEIYPSYVVRMQPLIQAWRDKLRRNGKLLQEQFKLDQLRVEENHIAYEEIKAEKIIFCDGIQSSENPLFRNLPFALNKGEALIIKAATLPQEYVFKKAITLVPLGDELFWAGASHEWTYTDPLPTAEFFEKTKKQLQHWLKIPFTIEGHVASVRPATLERRPFVGLHPHFPSVGILSGMGTKGCSLAPYFAFQFVEHLTKKTAILPEASVQRFRRILQPLQ